MSVETTGVTLTPMQAAEAEMTYRALEPVVAKAMRLLSKPEMLEQLAEEELFEIRGEYDKAAIFFENLVHHLDGLSLIIERANPQLASLEPGELGPRIKELARQVDTGEPA